MVNGNKYDILLIGTNQVNFIKERWMTDFDWLIQKESTLLIGWSQYYLDWIKKKIHEKLKHIKMVACDQYSVTLVLLFSMLSSNERMGFSRKDPVDRISKNF